MRFSTATALALAGALSIAQLQAQQAAPAAAPKQAPMNMQDTSRKVPGGGIKAAGWQGKVDAGEAAKGGKIEDSKLVLEGGELQLNNGPAAVYWNPANKVTGDFTVSATFTEPKYMSSNDHPHPYGLFIGGNKLDTDQATLIYCTPYGSGTFILRGFGPAPFRLDGGGRGTPSDAVHKAEPGGSVTQDVEMSVKGDKVECKINGTTVASHSKSEVVGAGKLESTDGLVGIRAAHNVDVNIKNFKVTK
ncbi:MAG TPA: hypothetical protein VF921_20165 [Vicinamibacterales bacterium]